MTSHQLLTLAETIKAELLPRFPEIQGVRFKINTRYRTRAGTAFYERDQVALSHYYFIAQAINDGLAHNTIRHELAHIAAYKRFGRPGMGHGHLWRATALAMGCNGHRCTAVQEPDELSVVCRSCSRRTSESEKRMRRWAGQGRRMICRGCRSRLSYPWEIATTPQMAAEMVKRIIVQKGLTS